MQQGNQLGSLVHLSRQKRFFLLSKQMPGSAVKCIQDVTTRWWLTYSMCARLLRLKPYFYLIEAEGVLQTFYRCWCNICSNQVLRTYSWICAGVQYVPPISQVICARQLAYRTASQVICASGRYHTGIHLGSLCKAVGVAGTQLGQLCVQWSIGGSICTFQVQTTLDVSVVVRSVQYLI